MAGGKRFEFEELNIPQYEGEETSISMVNFDDHFSSPSEKEYLKS